MTPRFSIIVEPERSLVRMWMSGLFQPSDVDEFRREVIAAMNSLRCPPHQHVTLVDIRDMAVQLQVAVAEFEKVLHTPSIYSRRLAVVVETSLCRSQIKRAAAGRDARLFDDIDAAEAWLLSDEAQAA